MISLGSLLFRINCTKSDRKRDEGLTTPVDVERFDNIAYGKAPKWQLLDVYRPKASKGDKLPVIVSAHGGGWIYGDKEVYQFYCMSLAQRGFVVVNYNYRLAPEHKFPAAMEDTNLVFEWVMENAETYGMDLNNVFLLGDSAGGQITGIYANIATNKEYAKNFDFKVPEGLKIKALGLNCGKYNINPETDKRYVDNLFKKSKRSLGESLLSVTDHITETFPPCFIFTANGDFLKEEPVPLLAKLKQKNVHHEFKIYGSDEVTLYHVFHCNVRSKEANITNDDECNFFKGFIS